MQKYLLLFFLALLPLSCHAQQRVEVWSYLFSPPFKLDAHYGLSQDFVDLLNNQPANAGRFRFELVELPRKRLEMRLNRGQPGVLLWSSPEFFNQETASRGRWSQPILADQQSFVSLPDAPFEYEGPKSLEGLTLGGVLGYRYQDIEREVQSGTVIRQDVNSDLQNLEKLLSGRIHTLLIAQSTLLYYQQRRPLGQLYISTQPLYHFNRHLMLTHNLDEGVARYVSDFVSGLPENTHWRILLLRYGLGFMVTR